MKVIIFGIGQYTDAICNAFRPDVEIVCCIDNDSGKHGSVYAGAKICSITDGVKMSFDYIIIGFTMGYDIAIDQLKSVGVSENRVIIPYLFDHSKYSLYRDIFFIDELNYLETDIRLRRIENHIENFPYEFLDDLRNERLWIPIIKSWKDTIREIVDNKRSISRFGDGEFDLILGRGCSLQENDGKLASLLREVLASNSENLMIGIPDVFGALNGKDELFKEIFRRNLTSGGREQIYSLLKKDKIYYDSFVTRPYKHHMDRLAAKEHFLMIRKIWENRDVTIIEGAQTRMGIGNDLFSDTKSMERIICPVVNAFDRYDEILDEAKNICKDRLILIALGPTATVLARDLTVCGYQAIDIGHIDVEYEWYLRGEITAIEGKYVNEAPMGRIVNDKGMPEEYYDQIVARIGV